MCSQRKTIKGLKWKEQKAKTILRKINKNLYFQEVADRPRFSLRLIIRKSSWNS
jgi:hypothetical protein